MMWDGWWAFGPLMMLLFWVFVIAGVVWLVLTLARPAERTGGSSSARRILDERFARGEIDEQEFRARRAALDEGSR